MHECIIPYSTGFVYPTTVIALQVHVHGVCFDCSYMHNNIIVCLQLSLHATVISGPDTFSSQLYHRAIAIQYTACFGGSFDLYIIGEIKIIISSAIGKFMFL